MSRMCIPWLVIVYKCKLSMLQRVWAWEAKTRDQILALLFTAVWLWMSYSASQNLWFLVAMLNSWALLGRGAGEYPVHLQGCGIWRPNAHDRQQYSVGWERVGSLGTGERNCSPTLFARSNSKRSPYLPTSSTLESPRRQSVVCLFHGLMSVHIYLFIYAFGFLFPGMFKLIRI